MKNTKILLLLAVALVSVQMAIATPGIIRPDGIGFHNKWSTSGCSALLKWQCVDEVSNTTTDYVYTLNTTKQTFTLSNVSANESNLTTVTLYYYARRGELSNNCFNSVVRLNGVDYVSNSSVCTTTIWTWTYYWFSYPVSPATGLSWTVAEVNALEAGAVGVAPTPGGRIAQIYAYIS
jgi:hypothetical protein